ncbi:hypothetical protein PFISCL1PPCAC_27082, partial [Pristionchus fissidentatus]
SVEESIGITNEKNRLVARTLAVHDDQIIVDGATFCFENAERRADVVTMQVVQFYLDRSIIGRDSVASKLSKLRVRLCLEGSSHLC